MNMDVLKFVIDTIEDEKERSVITDRLINKMPIADITAKYGVSREDVRRFEVRCFAHYKLAVEPIVG